MRASFKHSIAFVVLAAGMATGLGCRPSDPPPPPPPPAHVAVVDVWAGTWKLNPARSTYALSPAPKSVLSTIEPLAGGWSMTQEVIDAAGAPRHEAFKGPFDGKDYPAQPGSPVTIALTKFDDHTVEFVMKNAGVITTTTRLVVAPDGKSRTSTTTGKNAQGRAATNVALYEKQ